MKCAVHGDTPLFSRPVPGFEGIYSVTFDGRVYSHARVDARGNRRRSKWLQPILSNAGYLRVHTCVHAVKRKVMIHRLVAGAFIGNPGGLPEVNHIDGDKTNNTMTNLEWVTTRENFIHALRTGLVVNLRDPATGRFLEH